MLCLEIGQAIKSRRLAYRSKSGKSMSQEVLAERIGHSRDYVVRLESGKHRRPDLGLVLLIARALELAEAETNELLRDCGHDSLPPLVPVDRRPPSAYLR